MTKQTEAIESLLAEYDMANSAFAKDLRQALEQSVAQIDTSAERVEKEAENVQAQQEPLLWAATVDFDSLCDPDDFARNFSFTKHGAFQIPLSTPQAQPAGYAKKIESLIAERDALKAKLAEQPRAQSPDGEGTLAQQVLECRCGRIWKNTRHGWAIRLDTIHQGEQK